MANVEKPVVLKNGAGLPLDVTWDDVSTARAGGERVSTKSRYLLLAALPLAVVSVLMLRHSIAETPAPAQKTEQVPKAAVIPKRAAKKSRNYCSALKAWESESSIELSPATRARCE